MPLQLSGKTNLFLKSLASLEKLKLMDLEKVMEKKPLNFLKCQKKWESLN